MTGKALAVAVPVIMAGNVSLALFSGYVQKLNKYAAMAGAAFVKWGVMSLGIKMLISGGKKLPAPAITSLTITQLYTALGGAVVAALVLAALDRSKK